jgi:hypothetical protein
VTGSLYYKSWTSDNDLVVPKEVTLTLDPGVVVKFTKRRQLTLHGSLVSKGTDSQRVLLTSWNDDTADGDTDHGETEWTSDSTDPQPGDWRLAVDFGITGEMSATDMRYRGATAVGAIPQELLDNTYSDDGPVVTNLLQEHCTDYATGAPIPSCVDAFHSCLADVRSFIVNSSEFPLESDPGTDAATFTQNVLGTIGGQL